MSRQPVPQRYSRPGSHRRRFLTALLAVPFMLGVLAAPAVAPSAVHGDELSDARAQQQQLARRIAEQKTLIAQLNASQDRLEGRIASTKAELEGITDDLSRTRKRVAALVEDIDAVTVTYEALVRELDGLDRELEDLEDREAAKREELRLRKAELAERIRRAYDAERTSMLETFLSGASFTDMLVAMSTELDAAEQDRMLAGRIAEDRATLLALHETVEATRDQTDVIRQETAVQKQKLDQRLKDLRKAQAKLVKLEKAAKAALAAQKAQYAKLAADKAELRRAMANAAAARKRLERKIDRLVAAQFAGGNIPSQFSGSFRWPMPGTISQPFGCTGFSWNPPHGDCAHWHSGIDIVAPYGTPVRAAAAGRVVYIGWNYADGADPAWIVIIAHASNLTTWYAHLQARYPVRAGQDVAKGQVIGYEGNTGRSTGAHLHWMVQLDGAFVNPRLFT